MKRIILSIFMIGATLAGVYMGGTGAFFSDTETSVANVMSAGDIDLKIDNESYYNGSFNEGTSWDEADLTLEKFFDFSDVKPGDYGEDTISLHVRTNDAYLCGAVTLTSNNENQCNEPEAFVDTTCGTSSTDVGASLGELAGLVNFLWWADDGDNVLENDESVISQGTFGELGVGNSYPLTFADSVTNIWNEGSVGGAVAGDETYYIGKAWCFGDLEAAALTQDNETDARSPDNDNNDNDVAGEPEDGGVRCDGSLLSNVSQTDSLTADIAFSAVQARHNSGFRCEQPRVATTSLTLVKEVTNDDLGAALPTAWTLTAQGPTPLSGVTGTGAVTNAVVAPGEYTLGETNGPIGYTSGTYSCRVNGGAPVSGNTIVIAQGDTVVCTIINDDSEPLTCTPQQSYADTVVSFDQGVRKDGSAIALDRTDPLDILGAPQSTGAPFDNPVVAGSFYSLGFDEGTDGTPGEGGKVVVSFSDNYIIDGPGNDIRAWEITGGTSYPVEKIKIEASQDGSTWVTLTASADRDTEADLASGGLAWARYVRITDVSVRSQFEATADAYDLDAVSALNCRTLVGLDV